MNKVLLFLVIFSCGQLLAQSSDRYNSVYKTFYQAEDLFQKEQYAAARKEFHLFMNEFDEENDPFYVKASFYEAISALELYNNDAIDLLLLFNKNYPESIYKTRISFKLGQYFYYKKKYDESLTWFNKLSIQDVEEDDRDEFYFKLGYANFQEENFEEARNSFHEIKDGTSQYANPALYYYSYIAYQNNSYQLALDGFLKLENDEQFGSIAPYYIAQIYYLQGNYDAVTEYAPKIVTKEGLANENDMNLLIGDAYYRTGRYDEAVPYLENYNRHAETTRDDNYQLAYAYYKSKLYTKAIPLFDKVKKVEDSLGQVSYYHIAECLLKLDNKVSARSAFEGAAFMDFDKVVAEDVLYNYAVLSYKLDINPYDEAVEAFEMYLNQYPNTDRKDDVYQYLVNVYTSTNNYTKALASLDKLPNKNVRLKAAYQMIAFNQGVERFQKSDFTGAKSSFKLVGTYPIDLSTSALAVFWTADANYRLANYDEALSGYKQFIVMPATTNAIVTEAKYNIGYCYLMKADSFSEQNKKAQKEDMLEKSIESFRLFTQSNPPSLQKKADAFMRIADGYFVLKNNELAVKFYKDAIELKSGYEDQALFYLGKTYGYMEGRLNDKISSLLDIVNNYKNSKYLLTSINEVAESYKSVGQFDKALSYYKKIVFDYPSSNLLVPAKINIADIYFKQGKYNQAEESYKDVLEQHGSDIKVCEKAAEGLKDLYIAMNQPEKVEALSEQYACANISPDEKENLYYLPAIEVYMDSTKTEKIRFENAIPKLEKYLEKFPSGRYKNEVKNYLANCHYTLENVPLAVEIYRETLEGPNTSFTELAAARVSHYLYNEERYEEVIIYYKRLEDMASTPAVIFNAKLGLMRSHFLLENWTNSVVYADKVLTNSEINNEIKLEANYAKGMSHYYLNNYTLAKTALIWIVKNTTTVKASEAKYSLADLEFKQGNLVEADAEIAALLKMKPTYNYWVAKALILRSRVLIQLDDLFQAEQNLKSVIDHYPIDDDGVLDEATQLWDELMQLKNQPKELKIETNPVIEINKEGN